MIALAAVMTLAGCALDKQGLPPLAGPSELGLSLTITASPDVITQDGVSQSVIQVTARNADSQPVPGLGLRVATLVGGTPVDFGQLSSKALNTGGDGRATVTYTAPPPPLSSTGPDPIVTIQVTPVDSNYANTVTREVEVRLAKPGVILAPTGAPLALFVASPTDLREGDTVYVDGSTSCATNVSGGCVTDGSNFITRYEWNFGNGDTDEGVTSSTQYALAGTYNVTLTVTDKNGQRATSNPLALKVNESDAPKALFTSSPAAPLVGDLVFFDGRLSTATSGRQIVSWEWSFGDGTFGTGATVTHTYITAGTYTVVLKVTDNAGKTHGVSATVKVS